MADENDMKTSNAAGPNGTESPVKSPVSVPGMSSEMSAAVDAAILRQRAFARLSPEMQIRAMADWLLNGGLGDD